MDSELEAALNKHDDSDRPPISTHQWNLIMEAARKYANPDYEAAFEPLMNFRKWVKETDEITDHDLLVTAKHIAIALGITHPFDPEDERLKGLDTSWLE